MENKPEIYMILISLLQHVKPWLRECSKFSRPVMKLKKNFLYACTWISQHHISFPSNTRIP